MLARANHRRKIRRVCLADKAVYVGGGYGSVLHVESGELHDAFARELELPHPQDHIQHFLRVPGPEIHALEESPRVAVAIEDVVVHQVWATASGSRKSTAARHTAQRVFILPEAYLNQNRVKTVLRP